MKAFGGDGVVQLLSKIKANTRQFRHVPIGPIGAVLSLQNDTWATAVEASIGAFFNNFIVDNDQDFQTLSVRPVQTHGPEKVVCGQGCHCGLVNPLLPGRMSKSCSMGGRALLAWGKSAEPEMLTR